MSDRCLFLTGASSDTGMEFLEKRGEQYSLIYAHYNHGSERFFRSVQRLGDRVIPLKADFSSYDDLETLLEKVGERGVYPGHFIHLVSDKMIGNKFHKREQEDFDRGYRMAVGSAVCLLKCFLEKMMRMRYGRVVFMLSSCTLSTPPKYQSAYVSVKYALLGLMRALAVEYAPKGITVNGVSPDMMDTKFLDGTLKKEVVLRENAERNPLKRNIGIDDVLPVLDYLLSDQAEAVTGQNIGVTGGLL
ncbi:MAG: SDR family oxidoreductase [Lachnospiraceae bacterium]|nr:SDR family oxidoreductase [Lachnospiraceae bacterium]